ncbi:MAG: Uma2 family endonuclease [Acidobacteria bacterium]|nr:MAG: Uma2 family endonuclease [Acidobacteriota bacterium]
MGEIRGAKGAGSPPVIHFEFESVRLTDGKFDQLRKDNPKARLELTADGELIALRPTGAKLGAGNLKLNRRLKSWSEKDGRGRAFDSSAGFTLPNGAKRSPEASWLPVERWDALSDEEQQGYAPICPDFVVELRVNRRQKLRPLKRKMAEYIDNGAELGWLIDPVKKRVHVYRPGNPEECLENPAEVSGEPILTGFTLRLKDIW